MSRHAGSAEGIEPRREDGDLDAVVGRVIAELLERSHLMRPAEVSSALTQAALPLGVSAARIYLADLQQRQLALLPAGEGQGKDAHLAFDAVLDHLEKQVRRYKRRLKNHHEKARTTRKRVAAE